MKKTLLAGASLAVMFTAANALADPDVSAAISGPYNIDKVVSVDDENKTFDGADITIKNTDDASDPAKLVLKDSDTVEIKNSTVTMSGAPNGVMNGINSTDGVSGTVNFENSKVDITDGAGIAVGTVNIKEGTVVNASGYMETRNPETAKWQSGSMIQGGKAVNIEKGAEVNLSDGAQIVTGYPDGKISIAGTVNMSGENAMIRAASSQDGAQKSELDISGAVRVLKDSVGIIASRLTNVAAGGLVEVATGGALNLIPDMNRGADADQKPTGEGAFNVAGALVNSGTINAENVDITVKGQSLADAGENDAYEEQVAGGEYVSDNGTLNGNLTLSGENTPGKDDSAGKLAAILKAAPKASFSGNNTVNGNITNTNGLITVNKGAVVNMGEEKTVANNGYIDLAGKLNGAVSGSGQISVIDSAAHVTSFDGNSLNISADTSSSSLVGEASEASQVYVAEGASFSIDNGNISTDDLVVHGSARLDGVDYESAKVSVKNGTLDLGSNKLTSEDFNLWGGSTLVFNIDKSGAEQAGGQVDGTIKTHIDTGENVTINPVLGLGAESGEYAYASGMEKAEGLDLSEETVKLAGNNAIYNIEFAEDGFNKLNITKKDSGEVASSVAAAGGNASNANTVNAWVGGNSDAASLTGASKAVAEHLNTLAQTNPGALVDAATALAPETAAMVQHNVVENTQQVFAAVSSRLSGGAVATGGKGMSSGDSIFKRGAMWIQGLFNHAKLDDTRKAKGFDADSEGIALGAEKYVNDDVKLGVGYAYTTSDIDGFLRTTDVDTHTAFAYGEYKPSDWFVNGIATYNWSDYSEKKNVAGMLVDGDYDVNSIGLQVMSGYDFDISGVQVTPEAGLRYINIRQDSYRDSAGQRVGENTSDILTGVVGASVKKDFALDNGMNLRPEARVAMTYDMFNDAGNSVVTLANGAAYTVNGQALDRFGVEAGVGLTADVNDNVELSLGYEGRFRDHYEDHTGLINAKYKF